MGQIELVGVTAYLVPAGTKLDEDDVEEVQSERYRVPSVVDSSAVFNADGVTTAVDIYTFALSFPSARAYGDHLWDCLTFVEWEAVDCGELLHEAELGELASVAKILLSRKEAQGKNAVRFLTAWELTTTPAGWVGLEYWEPAETTAELFGLAEGPTNEGMKIVSIEKFIEENASGNDCD
jgi:hypothetical protein